MVASAETTRRIIFVLILISVIVPMLLHLSLGYSASPEVEQAFANLDTLPPGAAVLISSDFEASAIAEVGPLARAIIRHAFERDLRIVGVSLFAEGTALGEQMLVDLAEEYGKVYGTDYVYLGFRPQYIATILAMGESIGAEFPNDYYGTFVTELPLMAEVGNYDDIALVVSVYDGSMPTYWAEYAVAGSGVNLQVALTATMATAYYPYLDSGQIKGLVAGLQGAAEYEKLLNHSGGGKRGVPALAMAQLMLIAIILFGNLRERIRRGN
jgi:hypothetical protein